MRAKYIGYTPEEVRFTVTHPDGSGCAAHFNRAIDGKSVVQFWNEFPSTDDTFGEYILSPREAEVMRSILEAFTWEER